MWWEKSFSSSGEKNISTWTPADFAHILMFFFLKDLYWQTHEITECIK